MQIERIFGILALMEEVGIKDLISSGQFPISRRGSFLEHAFYNSTFTKQGMGSFLGRTINKAPLR